jgi:hypothetical protein
LGLVAQVALLQIMAETVRLLADLLMYWQLAEDVVAAMQHMEYQQVVILVAAVVALLDCLMVPLLLLGQLESLDKDLLVQVRHQLAQQAVAVVAQRQQ